MTAEDRKLQILRVAVSLFSQKGFGGTTTKEIALAAKVNEAIIFRHFATKDDLYTAILDCKAAEGSMSDTLAKLKELAEQRDDCSVAEDSRIDKQVSAGLTWNTTLDR